MSPSIKILAIETSCDETAIAIVEGNSSEHGAQFRILGNALLSQIDIHKEYGGVFPALAKREHAKNLVPILEAALEEAELLRENAQVISEEMRAKISEILAREPGLTEAFFDFISECEPPEIDAIAVTAGPGLEPALWVGINFARALAETWQKPLVAVNHMEGHVIAALASGNHAVPLQRENGATSSLTSGNHADSLREDHGAILEIKGVQMPLLALLISGGHTELVLMKEWLQYELIGATVDDAVGEAYDKVARMLTLPYPGGPEISRLAEQARSAPSVEIENPYSLPRPMLRDGTCNFSFAGLKTAVMQLLKKYPEMPESEKKRVAREFEDSVSEVLWKKTAKAIEETGAQTLVIGGGVSANTHIRRIFKENIAHKHPEVSLCIPTAALTTDNAIMIALAGFYRAQRKEFVTEIVANGNLSLA